MACLTAFATEGEIVIGTDRCEVFDPVLRTKSDEVTARLRVFIAGEPHIWANRLCKISLTCAMNCPATHGPGLHTSEGVSCQGPSNDEQCLAFYGEDLQPVAREVLH